GAHERPSIDLAMQVGSAHRNSSCRLNTLWHGPSPADVMTVTKMRFCRGGRLVCPYSAPNAPPAEIPRQRASLSPRTLCGHGRSENGYLCRNCRSYGITRTSSAQHL